MKTVLITGASRGIGRATALLFAQNNYNVVLNYLNNLEEVKKVAENIKKNYKVKTLVIKCNVAEEIEVKNMISTIKEKFDHLDCIVNNAGIAIDNDYLSKSSEEFMQVIKTNLLGTYLVTKYASIIMNTGSVINISSNGATVDGYVEAMDYDASKAGIITLTKDFAKRLSPKIRVNALCLGWIDTDMNKDLAPFFLEEKKSNILLGRFGLPNEVANVIYFLAEDATYINGSIITVDGGLK